MEGNCSYKSNFHNFFEKASEELVSSDEVAESLGRLSEFVYLLAEIDRANTAKKQNEKTSNN